MQSFASTDGKPSPELAQDMHYSYPKPHPPKDPRTKHKFNVLSRLLFCWVDPLFWIGCHRELEESDLYVHPSEADSERLLEQFNKFWRKELKRKRRGHKPWLSLVIFKCFWWRFLLQGVLSLLEVTLLVFQSLVLGLLVGYFSVQDPTDTETMMAYLYGGGMIALSLLSLLFHGHTFHLGTHVGMLTRISMTAAIYQKVLSLSQAAIRNISIGHVVNLASNDVQRFDLIFRCLPYIYIAPIHTVVVTYLVFLELGWSAFLVTGFVFVLLPVQLLLGKLFTHFRFKSIVVTDKRIRIMNEVISGIRVIKMYGWEYAFKRLVTKVRMKESIIILQGGLIHATGAGLMIISLTLFMFLFFSVFTATGGELTPKNLFTTLSLLITLRISSVDITILNILSISDIKVAITRLQQFLELNQINEDKEVSNGSSICVNANNISASWSKELDNKQMVLRNVSFEVDKKHPLLIVVGQVGAGKSSLLQCLLGELKPQVGRVNVNGCVSNASQEAWVFSGTLRDNVLFGRPYNPVWYQLVIEACALDVDIKYLADGDLTLVGERGTTLSGGQKARVNLARAVYHDADIFLLDDPLSAVDVEVAKHIFNKCFRELLGDRLVILVTHQLQFTLQASRILTLKEGQVEVYGSRSELSENGTDISTVLLGLISPSEEGSEQFSVLGEEKPASVGSSQMHPDEKLALNLAEDKAHGTISFRTYYRYFRAGASVVVLLLMIGIFMLGEGGIVIADWWLSDWATCSQMNITLQVNTSLSSTCSLSNKERIFIFIGVCVLATALSFARIILFYFICVNASRVLHNRMLSTIFRVPVRFFDTNPVGRVLNRFSKDVGFLDDLLPSVFGEYFLYSWRVTAIIFFAVASSVWILIPAVFLVLGFTMLRAYFLKTAREVKRLEAIARSPVYSHFSITLQGLATIRALKKEEAVLKLFHKYHNEHTQGWYLYVATSRWFGLRIDLLSAVFIAVVVFASISLSSSLNPALVGLVLTYVVSLTDLLQYTVRMNTEVENNMVSAERIMDYCKLESEASMETLLPNHSPPPDWPDKGQITMKNVSFQYSPELPFVLKDLCFTIQPHEKIGIIGRTGAGKSSLISVLYRLAEPRGLLTIDGIDIKTIGLHDLRKNISIIPQDPVLFSGTMHYNLDPFDEYSDGELWEALEQVQLKPTVQLLKGQLDGEVSEGGNNFSMGQRQLLCLARALLKKNRILVLDEATANVDMKTDDIIQRTIREKFSMCTVLTIAHRLNTVMDSDRIMVMSQGQLREFDSPYNLLQNKSSLLHNMVEKTGPDSSRQLFQMALDAHLATGEHDS